MDYDKYYQRLRIKNEERKNEFPNQRIFSHTDGKYHADAFRYQGFPYNFIISSQNSTAFGKDFVGLIVELYFDEKNYSESYFKQLKEYENDIEKSLNEDIILQSPAETKSGNVARIFVKKSVDIEDVSKWDEYAQWQIDKMIKFLKVLPSYTEKLQRNTVDNVKDKASIQLKLVSVRSSSLKNIILYGPPGVGKTYNHKKIVSLIENGKYAQKEIFESILQNNDEENIDETFEQIKKEGRIEFVTFHQSFSYEDFIEGFRPNEEGKIELEDGIFKVMADKARENLLASSQTEKLSFKAALDALLSEKIGNSKTVQIAMKRENSFYTIYDYNNRTIFFEKQKGDSVHNLSLKTLENMYNKESVDEIKGGMKSYYDGTLQALLKIAKKTEKSQPQKLKNHYLIIDEINRGNISKIFGELITLIEEDKRDSLHVTLPYSKRHFSVPSNLFIIATMNSTDKSIALIDIALRRRFTFLKMKPDSALVQAEAKELFQKLNKFITDNLGADFQIGHSYFMNYDDLDFVLEYKIKPLLEEYFFADPDRLEEAIRLLH